MGVSSLLQVQTMTKSQNSIGDLNNRCSYPPPAGDENDKTSGGNKR